MRIDTSGNSSRWRMNKPGCQMQTDIAVDSAVNVWAMNNWQDIGSCIGTPQEALSTRCGGQGVVVFFGMAKPVRAPQIGPARGFD
jgi:hypothetical protein